MVQEYIDENENLDPSASDGHGCKLALQPNTSGDCTPESSRTLEDATLVLAPEPNAHSAPFVPSLEGPGRKGDDASAAGQSSVGMGSLMIPQRNELDPSSATLPGPYTNQSPAVATTQVTTYGAARHLWYKHNAFKCKTTAKHRAVSKQLISPLNHQLTPSTRCLDRCKCLT